MQSFYGLTRSELSAALPRGFGPSRWMARQIFRAVYRDGAASWNAASRIPAGAREWLAHRYTLDLPHEVSRERASDDSHKVVYQLADGATAETVSMQRKGPRAPVEKLARSFSRRLRRVSPLQVARNLRPADVLAHVRGRLDRDDAPRRTLCLSSQVGCAMACGFCYTGTKGLVRNLGADEIVAQVVALSRQERVTGLVFMGMGEPMHNYDSVVRALRILRDDVGLALSGDGIHVSTCGLVPQMNALAEEGLDVRLALSLNATTDDVRHEVMPINKRWPITEVVEAARSYVEKARGPVMIEYVLMRNVNDSPDDARRLVSLLEGVDATVELIPFNTFEGTTLERPSRAAIDEFSRILSEGSLSHNVRMSKGSEVGAACGQLGLSLGDRARSRAKRSLAVG